MQSRSNKKKQRKQKDKKTFFTKKRIAIVSVVLAILLAASYFAGVFFYSSHVLKTVVYNDQKTGIKKYTDIDSYMKQVIEGKEIVIITADKNEKFNIPMKSIEPEYSIDSAVKDLKLQTNVWKWPVQIFTKNVLDLHVNMTINGELLKQRLTDVGLFDNSKRVATNDAKITVGESGVVIEPEKGGTQLDEEATFQKIKSALDKGELTIDVSKCTIPPVTSEKDFEKIKQEAQTYIDTPVAIKLGAEKKVLTAKQKSSLLTIDDKTKKVSVSAEGIEKLLREFNNAYIKSQGGTAAAPTVEFGGGVAKMIATANNILSMDVMAEVETVKKAIESGKGIDYSPVVKPNAEGSFVYTNTGSKITKTSSHFIEVSIPQQKLWIYQGDKVVLAADIVTGMESPSKNTPTVNGMFQILYKQQGATLRGATVGYTGKQDYNVKVNYWIPFESNGYGFHDAEGWKPYARYGGTYYQTEGSHGCVNMRNKDVKVLYDTVSAGTPVWVYR
ncbi:MAG: L,D-transpeptidase family protein [Culicoidibacterales bacterium]